MKKKVLIISDANSVGGAEKYIDNLTSLLSDTYQFYVAGGLGIQFLERSSSVHKVWKRKVSNRWPLSLLVIFIKAYRSVKPDIIHLNLTHPLSCIWIQIISLFIRKKVVMTLHIIAPYRRKRLVQFILNRTFSNQTVVFVSETGQADLEKLLAIRPQKSRIILNWVNTEWFQIPSAETKVEQFSKYALQKDRRLAIFAGRFEEQKNLLTLLDFGSWFRDHGWQLIFVGEGSQKHLIKDKIELLGIQDVIQIHPFVDQIRDFYWASDLFLLVSRSECTPLVLLEAMACGVPCVVTDIGDMRYMILDEQQAIPLEDLSEMTLATAITNALQYTPSQWREKVRRDYGEMKAKKQYISVYENDGE